MARVQSTLCLLNMSPAGLREDGAFADVGSVECRDVGRRRRLLNVHAHSFKVNDVGDLKRKNGRRDKLQELETERYSHI